MYTPEDLAGWKQQYGQVFSVAEYVVRPVTYAEYSRVRNTEESSADVEEALVNLVLLYPLDHNFDVLPAGLVSQLAEEILLVSGFSDPEHARGVLEKKREQGQDVFTLMKAMVICTMPAYTEEDLDALPFDALMAKVVLSEKIIEVQQAIMGGGSVTLELIDPNEQSAEVERERRKHAASKKPGTAGYDDPIAHKLRNALAD